MKTAILSDYDKQAIDFLESTGTTIEVNYLFTGPYFDEDKEFRDVYQFTLKNARGVYSAKFGDSTHNAERRKFAKSSGVSVYGFNQKHAKRFGFSVSKTGCIKRSELVAAANYKPGAYDILSCLSGYEPGSFEEFCSNYGYDDKPLSEYPAVMKTYQAVVDEFKGMNSLFNQDQLEQLAEIN